MSTWTLSYGSIGIGARDSARTFRFGGQQFFSNGYVPGGPAFRDLWRTADTTNYILVNGATPYEPYSAIIGLESFESATGADVIYAFWSGMYKSLDGGVTWANIVPIGSLPFVVSADAPVVKLCGKITLINKDFVWQYDETANLWVNIGTVPGNGQRQIPCCTISKEWLYLFGGCDMTTPNVPPEGGYSGYSTFNDVWRTKDGIVWEQVISDLPCQPKMWAWCIDFNGEIYFGGGYNNVTGTGNFSDTYKLDTETLVVSRVVCTTEYTQRHAAAVFVMSGFCNLICGNANPPGTVMDDLWRFTP
jgi:hypothetical protein